MKNSVARENKHGAIEFIFGKEMDSFSTIIVDVGGCSVGGCGYVYVCPACTEELHSEYECVYI